MNNHVDPMARKKIILVTLSLLVLSFVASFIFSIAYYRPPIGDDVLHQFPTSYESYRLNDFRKSVFGEQITDFPLLIKSLYLKYLHHSGRMVGYALIPLLSIYGQLFTAALTATFFIGVILLVVKNTFFEDNPLMHPVFLLSSFLILFYFFPAIDYLLMWTFASIYVAAMVLLLAYITVLRTFLQREGKPRTRDYVLINVFGLLAGFTHEVFALIFLLISFLLIVTAVWKQKKSAVLLYYLPGLAVGFLLTFFAPGNFARLSEPHDAPGQALPLMTKLWESIMTHKYFLVFKPSIKPAVTTYLFPTIIFVLGFFFYVKQFVQRLRSRLIPAFEDIIFVSAIAIVCMWSFFPYTPTYGVFGFTCLLTMVSLIAIKKSSWYSWISNQPRSYIFTGVVVVTSLIALLYINAHWLATLTSNTRLWREKISQAKIQHQSEVHVPKYPDFVSNRFTFFNYNNNMNGEFQTEYYKTFYKINVIPQ